MKLIPRYRGLLALGLGTLISLASGAARAEQFVLFDATYTYTWQDAINSKPSQSHYYVNEGNWLNKSRPTNWTSPVNYRNGKIHIRAEVFEKPAGDQQVGWAICYIANQGGYGCAYTTYYKATGIYERDIDMTAFWNNQTIQWDRGIKQIDVIYTINDSGSGHVNRYANLKDLTTPTRLRLTVTQVSQGDSYRPAPPSDGGAAPDAGMDARGGDMSGGSGGTGGGGGTGGAGGGSGSGTGGGAGGGGSGVTGGGSGSGGATGGGSGGNGTGGGTSGGASGTGGASGGGAGGTSGTGGRGGTGNGTGGGGAGGGSDQKVSGSGCAVVPGGSAEGVGLTFGLALGVGVGALLVRRRRLRR